MPDKTTVITIFIIVLAVAGGLGYPVGAGVLRVEVGPTPTFTATATSVPTQTPLPTYTQPAASATPTPEPTWTTQPTYTPAPTFTPGPDPEQMFLDGLDAMCRASNGLSLDLFFTIPWDCHGVVEGADKEDWFEDPDFHKTATPILPNIRPAPTITPTPPVYRPNTDPLRGGDGSA